MNYMPDPYRGCEKECTHDLGGGVCVTDLRKREGPYPDSVPPVGSLSAFVLRRLLLEQRG